VNCRMFFDHSAVPTRSVQTFSLCGATMVPYPSA
jgi:hypothetical protein